jgi:hypothetical protein
LLGLARGLYPTYRPAFGINHSGRKTGEVIPACWLHETLTLG